MKLIKGTNIWYEREDTGKQPILFFHGFNTTSKSFEKLKDLERNYDIISVDSPGNGKSTTDEELSLEYYNEVFKVLIKELNIDNLIVAGHSLGAHSAVEMVSEGVAKKAIIISPFNPFINSHNNQEYYLSLLKPKNMEEALNSVNSLIHVDIEFYRKNEEAIAKSLLKISAIDKFDNILYNQILSNEYLKLVNEKYSSNKDNIIVISGDKDKFVPIESILEMKNKWNVETFILNDIGHAPIFEDPNKVNDIINKIIDVV